MGILFVVRLVLPEHTAVYTETSDVQLLAQGDITLENDTISSVAEELSDEIGDEETATPQTDSLGVIDFNNPEEVNRILTHSKKVDAIYQQPRAKVKLVDFRGRPVKNKIKGTSSYVRLFNDLNDVQIATASRVGINRIADREAAAQSKDSLVYVGDNPYYDVKKLTHSIPYLVPRAAVCLEEIARAFMDSCVTKGLPMHKVVLTSVLRTEKDVKRLRRVNANASQNSCHQHGTTFDISYNHFVMVQDPNAAPKPAIPANRLKQILAEVLRDQRDMGTCFVKYEYRRSACFHITAR
ncbi:MAG: DUF5715 family protein [Prevotellamassilia sp.]|nr:DUF5715 family protein [Prevotellamassilia sp.]